MKEEYVMPVNVTIEAENPDRVAVALARTIYDAVKNFTLEDNANLDVQYSVYKKPDPDTFGK